MVELGASMVNPEARCRSPYEAKHGMHDKSNGVAVLYYKEQAVPEHMEKRSLTPSLTEEQRGKRGNSEMRLVRT